MIGLKEILERDREFNSRLQEEELRFLHRLKEETNDPKVNLLTLEYLKNKDKILEMYDRRISEGAKNI